MNQAELDEQPFEITLPLARAVKNGEEEITEVTVREPTRAQMKAVRSQPSDKQEDYAIFTCAGLLPATVDALAARDWHRISDWLAPFFQGPTAAA